MLKHWILTCDNDACNQDEGRCPARFIGSMVDFEPDAQEETKWNAMQAGWGKHILPSKRRVWLCPSCRQRAQQEQNPTKFHRKVIDLAYRAEQTVLLECGHEFMTLPSVPSEEIRECSACRLAWMSSGTVEEFPKGFLETFRECETINRQRRAGRAIGTGNQG